MALNDVYKATYVFNAERADGEMVFNLHYRTVVPPSGLTPSEEAQEIARLSGDFLETNYLPLLSTNITFDEVRVVGVSEPTVGIARAYGDPGLVVDQSVPLRSAPVASLKTGLRGRNFNGRIFLIAPNEADVNAGQLTPAAEAALLTMVDSLKSLADLGTGSEYGMTVYSPTLSGDSGLVVNNLVTDVIIRTTLGSQRSRQTVG